MSTSLARLTFILFAALAACACAKPAVVKHAAAAAAEGRGEPDIHGAPFEASAELATVRFEHDRDALLDEAREILKRNAAFIKSRGGLQVLVEGHCDELGTAEYNLALGQRRAKAVRDYYVMLGVPAARVATISYGKERPGCLEPGEPCRQANRRAEHKVRP